MRPATVHLQLLLLHTSTGTVEVELPETHVVWWCGDLHRLRSATEGHPGQQPLSGGFKSSAFFSSWRTAEESLTVGDESLCAAPCTSFGRSCW